MPRRASVPALPSGEPANDCWLTLTAFFLKSQCPSMFTIEGQYTCDFSELMPDGVFANALDAEAPLNFAPIYLCVLFAVHPKVIIPRDKAKNGTCLSISVISSHSYTHTHTHTHTHTYTHTHTHMYIYAWGV